MLTTLQTQPKKRLTPYAWVTTIAQLMAEEKPCYYAPWLRTQYHIPTSPSDYDSTNHDEMLIQRAVELQNQEHQITVENPNSIKVFGNKFKICIAGRPDIIAIKDDWIIVEDCKSGKKRNPIVTKFCSICYCSVMQTTPKNNAKIDNSSDDSSIPMKPKTFPVFTSIKPFSTNFIKP